jgi:3-oxoacyl-[acyl-carrier-protein] synthase III
MSTITKLQQHLGWREKTLYPAQRWRRSKVMCFLSFFSKQAACLLECDAICFLHLFRYLNTSIEDNEVDHALGSNGSVLDFPPKRHAIISCLQMNGKEVFRFAVRCVPQSIERALEKAGLTGSSIDWPLIHQA